MLYSILHSPTPDLERRFFIETFSKQTCNSCKIKLQIHMIVGLIVDNHSKNRRWTILTQTKNKMLRRLCSFSENVYCVQHMSKSIAKSIAVTKFWRWTWLGFYNGNALNDDEAIYITLLLTNVKLLTKLIIAIAHTNTIQVICNLFLVCQVSIWILLFINRQQF